MKQMDNRSRVVIESLRPQIDSGQFPIKRTIGEKVNIRANIFCDGHDDIRTELFFKHVDARQLSVVEMTPLGNDEWVASFEVLQIGELAPASLIQEPEAAPEPFSLLYQKSVYKSMRALALKVFGELGSNISKLYNSVTDETEQLLGKKQTILKRLARINAKKIEGMKIRIHGDYHLGQVLCTGKDFVIIDFEGEPAQPLGKRRLKQSALRDVAGMIRSFHYGAYGGIFLRPPDQSGDVEYLQYWADLWYFYMSGVFLDAYLENIKSEEILPADEKDFEMLLETFLLEKAIYELGYELNNRQDWLRIPVHGIENILKKKPLPFEDKLI